MEIKKQIELEFLFVSLIVALFFTSVVLSVLRIIDILNPYLVFPMFVLPGIYAIYVWIILDKKSRIERLVGFWNLYKKYKLLKVNEKFKLIEGEKIIFSPEATYLEMSSILFRKMVRDIVVTNKRIMIGFKVSVLLFGTEYFGSGGLWHSKIMEIPDTGVLSKAAKRLGGNSRIEKIEYKEEDGLPYLEIENEGPVKIKYKIYHTKSRKIYEMFSK